ncbi:substrate-binding domain-containing protein [Mangrovimonas spongiae]|uniref:ABC transporter substrate-binding protein n=1 Tax=Mangrovimonas spongiae TaxID=2494697 RepID=A0A3R9MCB1_9FLAO|nr:substrate-binding domain-containing protein [Mangrovimonas spongiae]RSK38635.1 ABC transporter substrate-binding protein [Mangrovimonas spongiae]
MKTVNVGGVPEHFNLAWYLALKSGTFKKAGINLRWKDYYGGTGDMCKSLRNGDIDLAVILTEGIIKDIVEGNPSSIVQTFVQSPLIWGIHVAESSSYQTISDLRGKKAAISRYGSGSHLMAYINAKNNNWNLDDDLHFEVIKNLDGAIKGLSSGAADYFMWEKFTTKPIVDEGIFRRIGNCPTPWPCFVIAARNEFIEKHPDELQTILDIVNIITEDFKDIPSIDNTIANRYNQKLEDVQEWLSLTEWSQSIIDEETVITVQNQLENLGIITNQFPYNKLVKKL